MRTIEKRVSALEGTICPADEAQYDRRSDYNSHLSYVRGDDGSCMDIPALNVWPDEASLWASRPAGTKFIRLCSDTAEVVCGIERPLHFEPVELTPDARLTRDEILRDLGAVRKEPTT